MTSNIKQLAALTVVATLAIAALGWFLLISPKNAQAAQLHTKATAQQATNATLRNELSILRTQGKNLVAQQARLADIATKVPDNPALPSLIRGLSDAADKAGVELVTIAPGNPVAVATTTTTPTVVAAPAAGAAAPAAGTPAAAAAAPASPLAEIPLTLTISGGFFPVEQFLANLEGLSRSFQVTGINAAPGTSPVGAGKAKVGLPLQVSITGRTFMTPAVAATAPAPIVKSVPAADPMK
ncbi:MAG: hypothetical protein NVSMB13_04010 [Mycobacteriales bacterium]